MPWTALADLMVASRKVDTLAADQAAKANFAVRASRPASSGLIQTTSG